MAQGGRAGGGAPPAILSPVAVLWGLVFAFVLAVAGGAVLGMAAAWSDWGVTPLVLKAVSYGSVVVAGFLGARRARRWGWLHGGLVGVLFLVIGTWALVPGFEMAKIISLAGLTRVALAFVAGAAGGMIARVA